MLPEPGEELFSSLLEDDRTPPEVFSDLSTVLLSMDLEVDGGMRGREGWRRVGGWGGGEGEVWGVER